MEIRGKSWMGSMLLGLLVVAFIAGEVEAWTGAVRGRVVCDVCGDSFIGPEDHALEGRSRFLFLSLFSLFWNRAYVFEFDGFRYQFDLIGCL